MSATEQRVLWVTGGGSGMGAASARTAAAAGWTVVVSGRRSDVLDGVVQSIDAAGGTALALALDVQDASAVAAARSTIVERFGRIDGLVLAAGRNTPERRWDDQDVDVFEDVVATNLVATVRVLDAALPTSDGAAAWWS